MAYRLRDACEAGWYIKPRLGYNQTFLPEFKINPHRHDTLEVMYAVDESFSCHIYSEEEEVHRVTVPLHGCLVMNHSVRHRLVIDRSVQVMSLEFEYRSDGNEGYSLRDLCERVPGFAAFSEADRDYVVFSDCAALQGPMRTLLSSILEHPRNPDAALALQQSLYVATFFVELTMRYRDTDITPQQGRYIEKVKAFIAKNSTENLTIPQIAQTVNLHPNYLERLFKKTENCTIVDYINHQRILRAAVLLRTTDWSIERVAYEVGFNNRQHFSKMFNRFIKMSPIGYRSLLHVTRYSARKDETDIADQEAPADEAEA